MILKSNNNLRKQNDLHSQTCLIVCKNILEADNVRQKQATIQGMGFSCLRLKHIMLPRKKYAGHTLINSTFKPADYFIECSPIILPSVSVTKEIKP